MDIEMQKQAIEGLSDRLCEKPKWAQNYKALLSGRLGGDDRVRLALRHWLYDEFKSLTVEEIKRAEALLVTRYTFAPDPVEIRKTGMSVAVEMRFGDVRDLHERVMNKTARWINGSEEEWQPVEAWIVREIGARRLMETSYHTLESRFLNELENYITLDQPDVTQDGLFSSAKKNDVKFYSEAKRKRRDFSSLKGGLGGDA